MVTDGSRCTRPGSEHDVRTSDRSETRWGFDDADATVESVGSDRVDVVGGVGIYDLLQPVVDRMVLSRIPGEYVENATFPEWGGDDWTRVEATPTDELTLEEWVQNGAN